MLTWMFFLLISILQKYLRLRFNNQIEHTPFLEEEKKYVKQCITFKGNSQVPSGNACDV